MELYLGIKKKVVTAFAGKWLKREIIMLSIISQAQKNIFFSYVWNLDLRLCTCVCT